jgi:hypothetical protein
LKVVAGVGAHCGVGLCVRGELVRIRVWCGEQEEDEEEEFLGFGFLGSRVYGGFGV